MADLELQVNDTHATITIYIQDENGAVVDLTNLSSATFVVRPEQEDEATISMTEQVEDEGTGDGATSAQTLTVSGQNFSSTVQVGDLIQILSGNDIGEVRTVTEVTSDTVLTHAGTAYTGDTAQDWQVSRARFTCQFTAGTLDHGEQECRVKIIWSGATESFTVTQFIIKGLT